MLQISINESEGTPIYFQLVRQLKHLMVTGRLSEGEELPPVRVLAQQLVINPNTVARAYRELETAGLIYTRRGAGTYVSGGGSPYSEAECRRILSERVDALIVEARSLGYSLPKVVELLKDRDLALRAGAKQEDKKEDKRHGAS